MLQKLLSRPRAALILAILVLAAATLAGAWIFQFSGVVPCELCLKERWPYYAALPIGLSALYASACGGEGGRGSRMLCGLLALLFLASAGFGFYHAGVEWGFWQGPTDCTGPLQKAGSMDEFWQQLQSVKVVRCDAAALRILGLSLAGWNAVISLFIAALAFKAAVPDRR